MGDDDYDDYSKELNQYRKSKDRGRGEFCLNKRCKNTPKSQSSIEGKVLFV